MSSSVEINPFSVPSFNETVSANDPEILRKWVATLRQQPELSGILYKYIAQSKIDKSVSISAANAISVLNASGINLSNRNFSEISIPGANLFRALLTNCNFTKANCTGVHFEDAILDHSTFIGTILEDITLGQKPFVRTPSDIKCMEVSSDGKRVLLGCRDNTVRFVDFDTAKELFCIDNKSHVYGIALSKDGLWACVGGDNGAVCLINCTSGQIEYALNNLDKTCLASTRVAFSPDSNWILVGGFSNMYVLDRQSGQLKQNIGAHSGTITSVSFSHDGKSILSADDHSVQLRDWDQQKEKVWCYEKHSTFWHKEKIQSAVMTNDGNWIVSGSEDDKVHVWEVANGKEIHSLEGHHSFVKSVDVSFDGSLIISGSIDGTVRLWDLKAGKLLHTFIGHDLSVSSVRFSEDMNYCFSSSMDRTVRCWDLSAVKKGLQRNLLPDWSLIRELALSKDGKISLFASYDNSLSLWDSEKGELISRFKLDRIIETAAISPDNSIALTATINNIIMIWDLQNKSIKGTINQDFTHCSFAPNGDWALCNKENTIILFDSQTKEDKVIVKGHTRRINALAFSSDSALILSGSSDKTVRLWDAKAENQIFCFEKHSESVNAVDLTRNGNLALSGGDDKAVCIWDCVTGKLKHNLSGHKKSVTSAVFSPDEKLVLSGSRDRSVRIWDVEEGVQLHYLPLRGLVLKAFFLPNGKEIIIATGDPTIVNPKTQSAIQRWEIFDEKNEFKPVLVWTSATSFSALQVNLKDIENISETNRKFLKQHTQNEEEEEKV